MTKRSVVTFVMLLVMSIGLVNKVSAQQVPEVKTAIYSFVEGSLPQGEVGTIVFTNSIGLNVISTSAGYYIETPSTQLLLAGEPVPTNATILDSQILINGTNATSVDPAVIVNFIRFVMSNPTNLIDTLIQNNVQIVITYQITPENQAPVIVSEPVQKVNVGEFFSYQVVATDSENDTLTYSVVSGPNGMNMDNGLLTWQTTENNGGFYSIDVLVTDGVNEVHQNFDLKVNRAPGEFQVLTPVGGTSDNSVIPTFSWTPSIDPDSDLVTYTLYVGAPDTSVFPPNPDINFHVLVSGITETEFTPTSELKYGTPHIWYVEASDGSLISTSNKSKFNTVDRPNNAPVADAGDDQEVISGDLVTLDGSRTLDLDGDQLGYIWSIIEGDSIVLENGNTVNPTFIAPEVIEPTRFTFRLWVTDSQTFSMDEVTVLVNPKKIF